VIETLYRRFRELRVNPVWEREMRQAARLRRTAAVLALSTIATSLLICAVGGIAIGNTEPARVGSILFHTFFSLAYVLVCWLGAGVAAVTIASERTGATWEVLLLTRLSSRQIAHGKFLAAFSHISTYIVTLIPVGALSLLFGGVSALDVLFAYLYLFIIAGLFVGFGLSVSSALNSASAAVLVTLPLAVALSIIAYLGLGVWGSVEASGLWPSVVAGAPVWLPTAYGRASWDATTFGILVLLPALLVGLGGWFFLEVTVSNIESDSGHYGTGLRRWYGVSSPLLTVTLWALTLLLFPAQDRWLASAGAVSLLFLHQLVALFVLSSEPVWPKTQPRPAAGWWGRAVELLVAPGIANAHRQVLGTGSVFCAILVGAGVVDQVFQGGAAGAASPLSKAGFLAACGGYCVALLVFLSGMTLFVRSSSKNAVAPRAALVLVLLVALLGPWLAMGIGGLVGGNAAQAMWLAAPSPGYVIVIFNALRKLPAPLPLLAAGASVLLWTMGGITLRFAAIHRIRAAARKEAQALHDLRETRVTGELQGPAPEAREGET
jgi:hypothetical protein